MSGSNTSDLCFADAHLWLYAFIVQQDPNKAIKARKIIQDSDICLSSQVINEVRANLLRKAEYKESQLR